MFYFSGLMLKVQRPEQIRLLQFKSSRSLPVVRRNLCLLAVSLKFVSEESLPLPITALLMNFALNSQSVYNK